jgi:hypothetical protein
MCYLCTPVFEQVYFNTENLINEINFNICQAVRKERDIKWLRTSVKKD